MGTIRPDGTCPEDGAGLLVPGAHTLPITDKGQKRHEYAVQYIGGQAAAA